MEFALGFEHRYAFYRRSQFELAALAGLGLQIGQIQYNRYSSMGSDSLLSPPSSIVSQLNISQKILGYIDLGLEAQYRIMPSLGIGVFLRWRQQIGHGYWYKNVYTPDSQRLNELPKYLFNPLEIGLVFSILNIDKHAPM